MAKRDYSMLGCDGARAVETGLAAAEWYHTDVPRKVMKDLMQRSDAPAIRDTLILYGCMIAFAGIGAALWPTWWSAPFWLAYGVLYGSASDSRWHECQHGTAFKTPWMNNVVYEIASFMIMRNSATWRWSHARHHSETYLVGRDPEIAVMRPPELAKLILNFFGIIDVMVKDKPANNPMTLVYKVYLDGFRGNDVGGSSAQSVILMIVVFALTIAQFRFLERRIHYS